MERYKTFVSVVESFESIFTEVATKDRLGKLG